MENRDGVVDVLESYVAAMQPPEQISPSEWAAKYRYIREGTSPKPGLWSNDYFPYLTSIMDVIQEALDKGKRGVVLMKSGQGGGSECMLNAVGWLLDQYPGPILYLISKDELAKEFGRERVAHIVKTSPPLAKKALQGRGAGQLIQVKRFVDGKVVIQGGQSILNLQSVPYRFVFIDEVDSLLDEVQGHGDPLKIAEIRTDSFSGQTLIVAFAHPSTRIRGAGKLYYEQSDQRRGFIVCPHCKDEFWLSPANMICVEEHGETRAKARMNPQRYHYVTPCCGNELTDAQRFQAARRAVQKSTLPPDEAEAKPWIGVHFSQFYMSNKPVEFLAEKWIEGLEDEAVKRVVINKRHGDVYDSKIQDTTDQEWRNLIVVPEMEDDPNAYTMGTVPPGVFFLTSGVDFRSVEMHYTIWGWGLVKNNEDNKELCGWMIEAGVVKREYSQSLDVTDIQAFDSIIFDRGFTDIDGEQTHFVQQCFLDSGWQPVGVYQYCLKDTGRRIPIKGDAEDSRSSAPYFRWGISPRWKVGEHIVNEPTLRLGLLNTYLLKETFFGLVKRRMTLPGEVIRKKPRLNLPTNVSDSYISQSCSEYKTEEKKKFLWKAKGANHYSDCNIYAFAAALNLNPFQRGMTAQERSLRDRHKRKKKKSINRGRRIRREY